MLSVFLGGFAAFSGVICCVSPYRDDDLVAVHIGLITLALWTGLFGIVTRGTVIGRTYARLGAGLAFLTVVLGMLALCRM